LVRPADRPSAVTVIIVNYNTTAELGPCLQTVAADLSAVEWTGVVVDNASPDGGPGTSSGLPPEIEIIRNSTNRGFGAAINQAARGGTSPLIWLLNPDCRVVPGAFAALSAELSRQPRCAVAAPRLLNADGSTQESARGEPTALTGLFGRHGLLARLFPDASLTRQNLRAGDLSRTSESADIDWAMGASLLIRRTVFDEVGGFDERFFLYWEDADLCRRTRDRGYTVRYVPSAQVTHVGEGSSRSARRFATTQFHRSAYLYYATHVTPSRWNPGRWLAWLALRLRAWWRNLRS
jgi:GT2 family glycosyltransferase